MSSILGAEQMVTVGEKVKFDSNSPNGKYSIYFVDDGRVGWCYAFDRRIAEDDVQCSLHVYNAEDFADRTDAQKVQIIWATDETKAAVILDGKPCAVFDFAAKQACCRSGLGLPEPGWRNNHDWDPDAAEFLG